MDSTDHTHLQRFCNQRKQNKTIGLHKKEYVEAICTNLYTGILAYIISECNHKMRREPMRLSLYFFPLKTQFYKSV